MTRQVYHGTVEAGGVYLDPMVRIELPDRQLWLYPDGEKQVRVEFEDKSTADPRDRRAAIRIGRSDLERLLVLPAGMVVVGIQAFTDPVMFRVVVQSPDLDPVPDACEAPPLDGSWGRRVSVGSDGLPYYRWEFQPSCNCPAGMDFHAINCPVSPGQPQRKGEDRDAEVGQ